MRIAVDARELTGKPTGVGRYLKALLTEWVASPDARRHEWHLYAPAPLDIPRGFTASLTVIPGNSGTRWEQWALARALTNSRPDVAFAPGYSAPLTAPCPIALTIHDLSFFANPAWFSVREGARRRKLTAWSARRAAIVLTDSVFSRDEIARHIGIPLSKIRVVPPGVTRIATNESTQRELIVLSVGSLFQRRHVDRLIAAFVESVAPRVPGSRLEIVGENRTYPRLDFVKQLQSYPTELQSRVTLHSYVDEPTLMSLYSRARVFAFPSEYEGFGFTPLEALSAGIPSVVLDTGMAREVYGPAARYVKCDLTNYREMADALVELLTNADARTSILAHAEQVLGRYDWRRTAAATLTAIEVAAGA